MSLLRLLTAGKCLIGVKDSHRYHLSRQRMLPKFDSKSNPFRLTTRPEGNLSDSLVQTAGAEPDSAVNSSVAASPELPGGASNPPPAIPGIVPSGPNLSGAGKSRLAKLAAALPWLRPKPEGSVIPRLSKPLVQGELSLDAVKVVRNDLSDSDLEVVTRHTVPEPASVAPITAEAPKSAEPAWKRVKGRLFGVGST
jgi:hypothetical protein